ncbi:MAG TPA: polysaccharide deacetylase family protein [Allosphingosinicella sp.]|nr:polysaccharide deacetylase family protein [Allosphingosinicella sp.]
MSPELLIVVDTEEEFDWTAPFSRESRATRTIPCQALAHRIYDRFGVVPTYVVDYPVATDPAAVKFLSGLRDAGKAEIGAHLHPWVTPPYEEAVTTHNSYHCNLPAALERAKIEALTGAIEKNFGERPTAFKAGRYGFGANTARVLADLCYRVDCSLVPHTDLSGDGGPDFRGRADRPHWLPEGLLEVPLTVGFLGAMPGLGERADWLFDSPRAARLRLPGALARSGLVARSRLTPEGTPADEQCRLIEAMVARGHRTFTLTYHSPSLAPGHTPYVRDEADLAAFLASIAQVLAFFRDRMGGRFTTLDGVYRAALEGREAA